MHEQVSSNYYVQRINLIVFSSYFYTLERSMENEKACDIWRW